MINILYVIYNKSYILYIQYILYITHISHGWEKEIAARARSEKRGNLARYGTGLSNEPEEEEEEEE